MMMLEPSEQLKVATGSAHRTLDSHPLLQSLTSHELVLDDYVRVLVALSEWLKIGRKMHFAQFGLHFEKRLHDRLDWIHCDLRNLIGECAVPASLFTSQQRPTVCSEAAALGTLYVVEGSALGGLVLAPRIEKSLARDDVTAFYRGFGKQTPALWQQTRRLLDLKLNSRVKVSAAIDAALASFEAMFNLLQAVSDNTACESRAG